MKVSKYVPFYRLFDDINNSVKLSKELSKKGGLAKIQEIAKNSLYKVDDVKGKSFRVYRLLEDIALCTGIGNVIALVIDVAGVLLNGVRSVNEKRYHDLNVFCQALAEKYCLEKPDESLSLKEKYDHWKGQLSEKAKEMTKIRLTHKGLKVIPPEIGLLKGLTELDLTGNHITEIPDSISKLANLEELYLCSNKIEVIPDSISRFSKLRRLNLYHNKIRVIPNSISKLENLEFLELGSNEIENIPESVSKLANLEKLYLYNNNIIKDKIPECIKDKKCLQIIIEGKLNYDPRFGLLPNLRPHGLYS